MKNIACLFDMDGVIIDNHRYHLESWITFFNKYGIAMSEKDYKAKVNGRIMPVVLKNLFGESITDEDVTRFGSEKEEAYRELYRPHVAPTPGLVDFLNHLKEKGVPCAVGTSAPPENVDLIMDNTGLRSYFETIIDDKAVTRGKPDPEVYQLGARALGVPDEQCVVFEDALLGIEAGKNAGMKVVAVATTHTRSELEETAVNLIINDFRELTLSQLEGLFE